MKKNWMLCAFLSLVLMITGGCISSDEIQSASSGANTESGLADYSVPTVQVPVYDADWNQSVTLTETTIKWLTYSYELDRNNSVISRSFDGKTLMEREFKAYVIENEYLRVTLVPAFGGRILSLIYKPTGHEELWQNPVGAPYLIGSQIFYHDWLMIYGGIFPTFPEPEHGKTWLLPWDFEIITDNGEMVEVQMSFVDTIDNPHAPANYPTTATGIECRFTVRLDADRAALDTHVQLKNPGSDPVSYEYWTNTGLAPGSVPGHSIADENTEIIVPIEKVRLPEWYLSLAKNEEPASQDRVYILDELRWFKNWKQSGILYAYPNMGGENYWGVINHANEEGIFRVADNTKTPGLKFWTFGIDSVQIDPFGGAHDFGRPFIELWAGVTEEFFFKTPLEGGEIYEFDETYSPSVGLGNVIAASENLLVNLHWNAEDRLTLEWFSMLPEEPAQITIRQEGKLIYDETVYSDVRMGNSLTLPDASGAILELSITDASGEIIFSEPLQP